MLNLEKPKFPRIKLKNIDLKIRIKIRLISVITLLSKLQTELHNSALSLISNCATSRKKAIFLTMSKST